MEDDFDGQNRMNLRHFIRSNDAKKEPSDDDEVSETSEGDPPPSYYYIQNLLEGPIGDKAIEQRRELQRIPTFAIFHKIALGKGVPHTFVGESPFLTIIERLIHVSW